MVKDGYFKYLLEHLKKNTQWREFFTALVEELEDLYANNTGLYVDSIGRKISLLKQFIDPSVADRDVLDKFIQVYDLPMVSTLFDGFVRRQVFASPSFSENFGNRESLRALFFTLGLEATIRNWYAFIGDYENDALWLPNIHRINYTNVGVVSETLYNVTSFEVNDGADILRGDELYNEDHGFPNVTRIVVNVEENTIYINSPADVYINDNLSVWRKPKNPINPDPSNYFKISHISVILDRTYITGGMDNTARLRIFIENLLPANVTLKQISINDEIPLHEFLFEMLEFNTKLGYYKEFEFDFTFDNPNVQPNFVIRSASEPNSHIIKDGSDPTSYIVQSI